MSNQTRLITIETRGPIYQKSGIVGPITTPYKEDVEVIARMIIGRVAVTEHLQDGAKRKLTVKDIPELTAQAPKVLRPNMLEQKEKNEVQKHIDAAKAEVKAETKQEEKAQDAAPVENVTVNKTEVFAGMSKKERRALQEQQRAEKAAAEANAPIEDDLEAK